LGRRSKKEKHGLTFVKKNLKSEVNITKKVPGRKKDLG